MRIKNLIFLIAIVSTVWLELYAQTSQNFKFIDASSGLLHPAVNSIVQDKQGFMWFATGNGLVRYNGHSFLTYTVSNSGLSSSRLNMLLIDKAGFLWIGSENGLDRMDLSDHRIEKIKIRHCGTRQLDKYIISIFQSSDGTIWAGSNNSQLFKFNRNSNTAEEVCLEGLGTFFPIKITVEDSTDGTIWIRSGISSLAKLDIRTNRIRKEYDLKHECYSVIRTPEYGLLAYTIDGLYLFDLAKDRFVPFKLPGTLKRTYNMFCDHKNNLWITRDAYFLYRYDGYSVQDYTERFGHFQYDLRRINCFYEDHFHNLWIGTTRGIMCFNVPDNRFINYAADAGNKPRSIRSITETSNGDLYFSGYNVFLKREKKTGKFSSPLTGKFTAYSLIKENDRLIWLLTEGMGLRKYDPGSSTPNDKGQWLELRRGGAYLISGFKDHDGLFWLGDYSSIFRFDPVSGKTEECTQTFNDIQVKNLKSLQFYETKDKHLWIASNMGLFELDEQRQPIRNYAAKGQRGYRLSNDYVYNILEDEEGFIWIATAYGFNKLDRKTGQIEIFTADQGLADNTVVSILEDNRRRLWLATLNGLSMFDINKKQFRNFHTEDGLTHNEFNHGAFYKSADGMMYFGGLNGINAFNPDKFERDYVNIPLLLSEVNILNDDDSIHSSFIFSGDKPFTIDLPFNNRFCRIQFALADYTRPEKNVYAYKLEGYDNNWVNIGNQSYIHFTSLPPGNYTVMIKAAGSNGLWTEKPLRLFLNVGVPFYKKWWFVSLLIVSLVALLFFIFRVRVNQIKHLADIRIKIASDLHDDVGSVLTRVAMQAELVGIESEEQRPRLLSAIMESCRTAMSNMRDVVWSIDARNDKLSNLIDRMNGHIVQMTESSRFTYSFEYDDSISQEKINPTDRQNIYLIFKESLNNILKHSNGNKISIRFFKKDRVLNLVISDNGTCTLPETPAGSGLKNMKMRAEMIHASLEITAGENGFKVELKKKIK